MITSLTLMIIKNDDDDHDDDIMITYVDWGRAESAEQKAKTK